MVMKRQIRVLGLLFSIVVLVDNSFAQIVTLESSYWEGHTYYSRTELGKDIKGRIDYAVYDTEAYPDEYPGIEGFTPPGDGQYIYAYQIFNDDDSDPVGLFEIIEISGASVDGIGWEQAGDLEAIVPVDAFFWPNETAPEDAVFLFGGDAPLQGGEHSYFLMFTSDDAPRAGDYYIGTSQVPTVPEPATIALLGLGGAMIFSVPMRRKRGL